MDIDAIDRRLKISLMVLGVVAVVAIGFYVLWFGWHLDRDIAIQPESFGQFGDYIGGLLNPLVAAYALYWLTASVRLQKAELAEARDILGKTLFTQREQAELTLKANRMGLMTAELNALTDELNNRRQLRNIWIQTVASNAAAQVIDEDGNSVMAYDALKKEAKKIKELEQLQATLMSALNALDSMQAKND